MNNLENELRQLMNRYGMDSRSNTNDIVLAKFLIGCLNAFHNAMDNRDAQPTPTPEG